MSHITQRKLLFYLLLCATLPRHRKPPKSGMTIPQRLTHKKSEITEEVLKLGEKRFAHHFGTLTPINYAVKRPQALMELEHFINKVRLYPN